MYIYFIINNKKNFTKSIFLNYIIVDEREFNDDSNNVHIYIKIREKYDTNR